MRQASVVIIAGLAACSPPHTEAPPSTSDDRSALTAEIEQAVGMMLPRIIVSQYARYYARGEDGHVRGLYLRECGEGWTSCPEAKEFWVSPDKLPIGPVDGGCGVVRVEYNSTARIHVTATCNGEA